MRPLSLKSSCDIELEEIPVKEPESRRIALLVMTTLMMYLVTMFDNILPLPSGILMLYIFKDLGRMPAKALILSDVLHCIELVGIFTIPILILTIYGVGLDIFTANAYLRNGCKMDDRVLFEIGAMFGVVLVCLTVPILAASPDNIHLWTTMTPRFQILTGTLLFVLCGGMMGVAFMYSFRGMKAIFHNVCNIEEVRLI